MIGPKPGGPTHPGPSHPKPKALDDSDGFCDVEAHHTHIGEPHEHSTPHAPGPADAAHSPSTGPGIDSTPAKGEEPTPGSAVATATAARESTGAVVAPGAANPDPSPGSGTPVSPPARGVGHSPPLQVGTAWCGIADVRRAARS